MTGGTGMLTHAERHKQTMQYLPVGNIVESGSPSDGQVLMGSKESRQFGFQRQVKSTAINRQQAKSALVLAKPGLINKVL